LKEGLEAAFRKRQNLKLREGREGVVALVGRLFRAFRESLFTFFHRFLLFLCFLCFFFLEGLEASFRKRQGLKLSEGREGVVALVGRVFRSLRESLF